MYVQQLNPSLLPFLGPHRLAGNHRTTYFSPLLLKYQSAKASLVGFLLASPRSARVYNYITDNANNPPLMLTAHYETATWTEVPLTLPEYVAEVEP